MSAADVGIQKYIYSGSGRTVIFSNHEVNNMVKNVRALEDTNVLMKGVSETLKDHIKKGGVLPILPMLLGTLGSSLIGNLLTGKGLFRAGRGSKCNCGQGMFRAGQNQVKGLFRAGQ